MKHRRRTVEGVAQIVGRDVAPMNREFPGSMQVREILGTSGCEIIDDRNALAVMKQTLNEMTADETSAAGDHAARALAHRDTVASEPTTAATTRSISSSVNSANIGSERMRLQRRSVCGNDPRVYPKSA